MLFLCQGWSAKFTSSEFAEAPPQRLVGSRFSEAATGHSRDLLRDCLGMDAVQVKVKRMESANLKALQSKARLQPYKSSRDGFVANIDMTQK